VQTDQFDDASRVQTEYPHLILHADIWFGHMTHLKLDLFAICLKFNYIFATFFGVLRIFAFIQPFQSMKKQERLKAPRFL